MPLLALSVPIVLLFAPPAPDTVNVPLLLTVPKLLLAPLTFTVPELVRLNGIVAPGIVNVR